MVRAISVLLAVLVLLGVGWYLGHRPVAAMRTAAAQLESATLQRAQDFEAKARALEERVAMAEARSQLWRARAELLVAAGDVGQSNYGLAAERASRARDLVTHALAAPGFTLDLGAVRDMLDSAIGKIGAQDRDAGAVLTRAAAELGRLLEQAGQA